MTLRALGLGDLLTALPALRALRRALPDHRHALICAPALGPLALELGLADVVCPADHRTGPPDGGWPDAPRDPRLAVNLHGRGPQSHRALAARAPSQLLAFSCPGVHPSGPRWRDDEHEVHRWMRLLEEGAGIPTDLDDLRIDVADAVRGRHVVVHPGAASPARRWPTARWVALTRAVEAEGHQVLVTGGPAERHLATSIAADAGLPPDRVLAGRTDVRGLLRLLAGARAIICGDTGPAHLATAVGLPSVLLFGPSAPSRWGPVIDRSVHRVLWAGRVGNPHGADVAAGLLDISVDDVLDAFHRLELERGAHRSGRAGITGAQNGEGGS